MDMLQEQSEEIAKQQFLLLEKELKHSRRPFVEHKRSLFRKNLHTVHLDAIFSRGSRTCADLQRFIGDAVKMLPCPVVAENSHPHNVFREAVSPDGIGWW